MKAKHWLAAFIAVICGINTIANAVNARSTTHRFNHRTKNTRRWKVPSVHTHSTSKRLLARSTVVANKPITPNVQSLKSNNAPSFTRTLGSANKNAEKVSPKESYLLNSLKKQKAALAKKVELARKEKLTRAQNKFLNPQTRQMVNSAAAAPQSNMQQSNWQNELPAAARDTSSAYPQQQQQPAAQPAPAQQQPQQNMQQTDPGVANAQQNSYQQQNNQDWSQQYDTRDTAPAPVPAAAPAPAPAPAVAAALPPPPPPAPAPAPPPAPAAPAQQDQGMQGNYQDDNNGQTIEVPGPDGKPVSYYVNSNSADIVPDPKGGMKVVTPKGTAQPVNTNQQNQKANAHAQAQPNPQQPQQSYDTSLPAAATATSTEQPKPEAEQHQSSSAAKRVYSLGDKVFASAGCYQDKWIRAIPTLEGNHEFLMDPDYKSRGDALQKCAEAALEKGFKAFALQNHGQCFAGKDGEKRFKMYGTSNKCPGDGLGGPWSSEVYLVQDMANPEATESHETAAAKSPEEVEKEQQQQKPPPKAKPENQHHKKKQQHEAEAEEAEAQSSEGDPEFNKAMQKEEEELIEAEKEETELTGGSKPKSSGSNTLNEVSANEAADTGSTHKPKNQTTEKHGAKLKLDVQPVLSETNIPLNLNVKIRENASVPAEQTNAHSTSEGKTGDTSETKPVTVSAHAAAQPQPASESHPEQQQQAVLANRTVDSSMTPTKSSAPAVITTSSMVKPAAETPKPVVAVATKPSVTNTTTTTVKSEKTVDEGASASTTNANNSTSGAKLSAKGLTVKPFVLGAAIARGEKPPCICPDKVCSSKLDLAFVVDASAGAEPGGNEKMAEIMEFGRRIASAFRIDPDDSHLGLITYSTDAQVMLNFKHSNDADALSEARDSIRVKPNTGTFTGQALTLARDSLFKVNHRSEALDVIVLITDGSSNDDVLNPSRSLRDMGVKIIAVGLGDQVNKQQLSDVASDPDEEHMFTAEFDNLSPVIRKVQKAACIGGFLKDPVTPCRCDDKGVNANPEAELETAAFFSILKHNIVETGTKYNFIPYPPESSPLRTLRAYRRGDTFKHSLPISNPHPPEDTIQSSESADVVNNQESQSSTNQSPQEVSHFGTTTADSRDVSQLESNSEQNAPIETSKQGSYNANNGKQGSTNQNQESENDNGAEMAKSSRYNNNAIDNENSNGNKESDSASLSNKNNNDDNVSQQTNTKASGASSQLNSDKNGEVTQQSGNDMHHQQGTTTDANYMETDEPEYTSPNEDASISNQGKVAQGNRANDQGHSISGTTRNSTATVNSDSSTNNQNNNNNNINNNNYGNKNEKLSGSSKLTSNQSGEQTDQDNTNNRNSKQQGTSNRGHNSNTSSQQNDNNSLIKTNGEPDSNKFSSNNEGIHMSNDMTGDEARGNKSPRPNIVNRKVKQNYAAESIDGYVESSSQQGGDKSERNQLGNKSINPENDTPQRQPMRSEADSTPDDANASVNKIISPASGRGIVNRHMDGSNQEQPGQIDNRDSSPREGGGQSVNGDSMSVTQNDNNENQQQGSIGQSKIIMNNNRSPRPNPIQVQVSVDVEDAKGDKQKDVRIEPDKSRMKGTGKVGDKINNRKDTEDNNQQQQSTSDNSSANTEPSNNNNSDNQGFSKENQQNQADKIQNDESGGNGAKQEGKEKDETKGKLVETKEENTEKEDRTNNKENRKQANNKNSQSNVGEEKQDEGKIQEKENSRQNSSEEETKGNKPNGVTNKFKEEKNVEESSKIDKNKEQMRDKPDVKQNDVSKESENESKQSNNKEPAQNEDHQAKESGQVKETSQVKEESQVKEGSRVEEVNQAKETNEVQETNQTQETNQAKGTNQANETNQGKWTNQAKETNQGKWTNQAKEKNQGKETNQVNEVSQTEISSETTAYNQPGTSQAASETPPAASTQEGTAAMPSTGEQQSNQNTENDNTVSQQNSKEAATQVSQGTGTSTNNGHGFTFTTTVQPGNIQNQTQTYQSPDASQQYNGQESGSSGVENSASPPQQPPQQQQQPTQQNQVSPQEASPQQDQSGMVRIHDNEANTNVETNGNNGNQPLVSNNGRQSNEPVNSRNEAQATVHKAKWTTDNSYNENSNANNNFNNNANENSSYGGNESQTTNSNSQNIQQNMNNNQESMQQNESMQSSTYNNNYAGAENSKAQGSSNNNNNEDDRHTGTNRDIDLTALNPSQSDTDGLLKGGVNTQQQHVGRQSQNVVGVNGQRPTVGLRPLLNAMQKQTQQNRPLANQNTQDQAVETSPAGAGVAIRPTVQYHPNQGSVYGKGSSSKEQTTKAPSSIASKLQQGNNYEAVNVGQGYETINDIVKYPHKKFGEQTQDSQAATNGNHNVDNKNTAEIDKKLPAEENQASKQGENVKMSQDKQGNAGQAAKPGNFQQALKESSKAVPESTNANSEKEKEPPAPQSINSKPSSNNAGNMKNNNRQNKEPSVTILKDTKKNNEDDTRKTESKAEDKTEKEPAEKANNQPLSFNSNSNNNALVNTNKAPMQRNDNNAPQQTELAGNQNIQIQKLVPLAHHMKNYQSHTNNNVNENAKAVQNYNNNQNSNLNNNNNVNSNNANTDNSNLGMQHGLQDVPVQQHLAFRLVRKPQLHIMGQPNNDVDSAAKNENSKDSQSVSKENGKKPSSENRNQSQKQGDMSDENKGKAPLVDNGIYKENGAQAGKQQDSPKGAATPSEKNTHQAQEPSSNDKPAKDEGELAPVGKEQDKAEQTDKKPAEDTQLKEEKKPTEAKVEASKAMEDSPRPQAQAPQPSKVASSFADQGSKSAPVTNQAPAASQSPAAYQAPAANQAPATQSSSNPSPAASRPSSNPAPSQQYESKPSSQQSSNTGSNNAPQPQRPSSNQPSKPQANSSPQPTQPPPPDPESEALMKEVDQTGQEMEQTMQESEQEMSTNEAESEAEMQKNEQENGDAQTRSGMRHHIARKDEPPGQNLDREDARSGVAVTEEPKVHKSLSKMTLAKDQNPPPEKGVLLMDPFLDASHYWPLETQDKNTSPDVVTGKLAQLYQVDIKHDGDDAYYASTEKKGASINLGDFNTTCFSDPDACKFGGLTVAFWVYLDTTKIRPEQDAYIVSDGGQSMKAHGFAFVHFHGKYVFILSTATKQWKMTMDELPNKSWHFMTFVWEKNKLLTFYLDGEKKKSVSSKGTNRTQDLFTNLTISMPDNANDVNYMFPLRIASFALWEKALKLNQVKTAANLITRLHTGKSAAQKKHIINRPKLKNQNQRLLTRLMPQLR